MFRKAVQIGNWQVIERYSDETLKFHRFFNKEEAIGFFEMLKKENPNVEVWPKDSVN
jgi:hypothetical protein